MKTSDEIDAVRNRVDEHAPSAYSGMTYEQGVAEALDWVQGYISDEEFEYAMEAL